MYVFDILILTPYDMFSQSEKYNIHLWIFIDNIYLNKTLHFICMKKVDIIGLIEKFYRLPTKIEIDKDSYICKVCEDL